MYETDIAGGCYAAIKEIDQTGWRHGPEGWYGRGGLCLEGALARVIGRPFTEGMVNTLGQIEEHRNTLVSHPLWVAVEQAVLRNYNTVPYIWNDHTCEQHVIQLLKQVAAEQAVMQGATTQITVTIPNAGFITVGEEKPVSTLSYVVTNTVPNTVPEEWAEAPALALSSA